MVVGFKGKDLLIQILTDLCNLNFYFITNFCFISSKRKIFKFKLFSMREFMCFFCELIH